MADRPKRIISKPPRYLTTSSDEEPKRRRTQTVDNTTMEDDIEDIRHTLQDYEEDNNQNNNLSLSYSNTYVPPPAPSHTHTYTRTSHPTIPNTTLHPYTNTNTNVPTCSSQDILITDISNSMPTHTQHTHPYPTHNYTQYPEKERYNTCSQFQDIPTGPRENLRHQNGQTQQFVYGQQNEIAQPETEIR